MKQQEPGTADIDEGSVTAWATFGAAMAEATSAPETTERDTIVTALDGLAAAVRDLADALRPES
jgi:hypothetical protein